MALRRVRSARPTLVLAAALAVAAMSLPGCVIVDLRPDVGAADVGLPLYPGAVKAPERDNDRAGVRFGMWGGIFGVKLAAVHYVSTDGVEPVARFYRDALARYGPVLDCSDAAAKLPGANGAAPKERGVDKDPGARPVTCGNDAEVAGGRVYKVGTEGDQRVFSLKPEAQGVSFRLVHLQLHDKG